MPEMKDLFEIDGLTSTAWCTTCCTIVDFRAGCEVLECPECGAKEDV